MIARMKALVLGLAFSLTASTPFAFASAVAAQHHEPDQQAGMWDPDHDQADPTDHGGHGEHPTAHLNWNNWDCGQPTGAHAAPPLAPHIVNFVLLLAIIVLAARKPLSNLLETRRERVTQALAEARELKAEADKKHAEYEARLAKIDAEMATVREEILKAASAERDRILVEAESKAARMRRDTDFAIEQQVKQLRIDLRREAAEAAVRSARELLTQSTGTADHDRIAREHLADVATHAKETTA